MIKISALNEESDVDSNAEVEVTKEALEQIALKQYAKALDLQRKGNIDEAMRLLKDLLETELLHEVKKPSTSEKPTEPLFNLKYLCYKNLGNMQSTKGEVEPAIESFRAASELDDTDVTLWHRFGLHAYKAQYFDLALNAFLRGIERNPRHWPTLDKIVTLTLGLSYYEECISVIHDALVLDPDYLRGLAYRKHIYTCYPYIKRFMEYLNPKYKLENLNVGEIDEKQAEALLKEAEDIRLAWQEQQKAEQFKCTLPDLKIQKPITNLSWLAVGKSLVHQHHYMTDHSFSHACKLIIAYEKESYVELMEVCEDTKPAESTECKSDENNTDTEKNCENGSENENNEHSDKDKVATDNEKVESDIEMIVSESTETAPQPLESKEPKKVSSRRRGSDLSFLQQWEWCNKRRSGRKKPATKVTAYDTIYDVLRKMVPSHLSPEFITKKENQARRISLETNDLGKLFSENDDKIEKSVDYFGTELEEKDVENFITKYTEKKSDIIDILNDFLSILSLKWNQLWPEGLPNVFVQANKCYSTHIDIPNLSETNFDYIINSVFVNTLAEEFELNEKLNNEPIDKPSHDLSIAESIGILLVHKPHAFGSDCLNLTLRYLWVKLHSYLVNKDDELALDCLYQLHYEFEAMGEECKSYKLLMPNFLFKPSIEQNEVLAYIRFLERNKRLSTVNSLYASEQYEEVLSIVLDSFEHCKHMARAQEEEMSLDFAVQLTLILESYWALGKVEECFKWSLICLKEALNHFFHFTSGCPDYDKWSNTVIKILVSMEHILTTKGLSCLDSISPKELSEGLENIIRIIGHQVETSASEMPINTVTPWIIMHYILKREDELGRVKQFKSDSKNDDQDIPNELKVLFLGHEQLGTRGWCCNNDAKLLYFILDTIVPQLRLPLLAKSLDQIVEHMEQCVYCLFGYPGKKNKVKYLEDHNVTAKSFDWARAQQVYEIFRPISLPELEGKVTVITADTESLFQKILSMLPAEYEVQKYVPEMEKFMTGKENKIPVPSITFPYKMRDIYFLLGDYYFKREEVKLSIKYNMLDIVLNTNRFESWAEVTLAKEVNAERALNSCGHVVSEKDFLKTARTIIHCFDHTLELESNSDLWIEYGVFAYAVHSFCSRLLKQASESLSMEDFDTLENQKEKMLDTSQKCFTTVTQELRRHSDEDKIHEGMWLAYYMLGKEAEKRGRPPSIYIDYYMKSVKCLQEADANYPVKINYNNPQNFSLEVLEIHYRIHASILKFIEQHENKPIPASTAKVFLTCLEEWKNGPFSKKAKKTITTEAETEVKSAETPMTVSPQAGNILKRSISDAGDDHEHQEIKKLRLEAAKVRRSASYDTERVLQKDSTEAEVESQNKDITNTETMVEQVTEIPKAMVVTKELKISEPAVKNPDTEKSLTKENSQGVEKPENVQMAYKPENVQTADKPENIETVDKPENRQTAEKPENTQSVEKPAESSSSTSSSSSDSSSSGSSSGSTSDSSRDSDTTSKSSDEDRAATEDEVNTMIAACIDALEDCVSRFPLHYKALYRLAHYHFYYKKGKDVERCRDMMLTNFVPKTGSKLSGLFGERKTTNFFNNIWRIPMSEIDRPGGFVNHMNRCVLLAMEILKEIDDHKTLLDMSLQLQRIPDQDKKYLRDNDREELAQQALLLCIQSLKGQLSKFSQQPDLKINEDEKKAFNSLMLDIYRAYQRVQKQPSSKQFTNLLVEGFKLVTDLTITENMNLVDLSMRYCQSLIQALKQQATLASMDKSQSVQRKQATKPTITELPKTAPAIVTAPPPPAPPKPEASKPVIPEQQKPTPAPVITPPASKATKDAATSAFSNYLPLLNDSLIQQQAKAAAALSLSYLSNYSALAGYNALHSSLSSSFNTSMQNSFQAEFYKQFLQQSFSQFNLPPPKKHKSASGKSSSKSISSNSSNVNLKSAMPAKSNPKPSQFPITSLPASSSSYHKNVTSKPLSSTSSLFAKQSQFPVTTAHKSSSAPIVPSMGTVLPTLPSSLTATLTSSYSQSQLPSRSKSSYTQSFNKQQTTVSKSVPSTQTSPSKTLQEKLAEKQKTLPSQPKPMPSSKDISSISKLPSSLTITKAGSNKPSSSSMVAKPSHTLSRPELKRSQSLNEKERSKPPITSDEIIVLDDD